MNTEDIKNLSEAVKNYIVTLGIAVGVIWAAYVFDSKLEIENANAKLQKLDYELTRRPVVMPEMKVFVGGMENSESSFVKVMVELRNSGNTDTKLIIMNNPFIIAKVALDDGGISKYENITYGEYLSPPDKASKFDIGKAGSITILAGQKKLVSTVFEVNKSGIYSVEFKAEPTGALLDIRDKVDGESEKYRPVVRVRDFILIDKNPNNKFQPTSYVGG